PFLMNWKGQLPEGMVSSDQAMHCDIFATVLDAAGIQVPKTNGKNPVRGMSLMPHMLSLGKTGLPERTMIFELWGNIGLRKGDYKLWSQVGREHSPDWQTLATELKRTDLALFDLNQDVAEQNDLRTKLPEVYTSLKTELLDHLSGVNTEYPPADQLPLKQTAAETPAVMNFEKPAAAIPTRTKEKAGTQKKVGTQKKAGTKEKARGSKDEFFQNRDRNDDGVITLEELIGNPKGRNVQALTRRFQRLDANGDGKLSLDEMKASEN
ncbi:hypothetical protein N9D23_15375, partial [Rubripirellula sp.]|nr:hypothetical protein [Rubripirellula sp.]